MDRAGVTQGDTCHLDVVDRWGTMVSATPSGGWLQSPPIIPALGFPLQHAIEAPKWHSNAVPSSFDPRDARPGEVVIEDRIGESVVDGLRRRGHHVVVADGWCR